MAGIVVLLIQDETVPESMPLAEVKNAQWVLMLG